MRLLRTSRKSLLRGMWYGGSVFDTVLKDSILPSPAINDEKGCMPKLATWNAHALLLADKPKRKNKISFLTSLASQADIITVQDVHGNLAIAKTALKNLAKNFWILGSFGKKIDTGGLLFLVRKKLGSWGEVELEEFIPGFKDSL